MEVMSHKTGNIFVGWLEPEIMEPDQRCRIRMVGHLCSPLRAMRLCDLTGVGFGPCLTDEKGGFG